MDLTYRRANPFASHCVTRGAGISDFEERDNATGAKVAVINQTAARFFFPSGSPLGRHGSVEGASFEIVGVVADVQQSSVRDDPVRRVYFPMVQMSELPTGFRLQVRVTGDPARLTVPIRRAILAADPSLILASIDPLADLTRDSISQDRLVTKVVTFLGGLALVLAAVGLYGVMAHSTTRRTTEFGLPSIIFAVAVLAVSAAGAGYIPARRAARVAPLEAIRAD